MANFEAINIYWDEILDKKNALLDIKYEDLVEDPENSRRFFVALPSQSQSVQQSCKVRFAIERE